MEDRLSTGSMPDPTLVSKKRTSMESGLDSEVARKRIRIQDLDSLISSDEGIGTNSSQSIDCVRTESSQTTQAPTTVTSGNIACIGFQNADTSVTPVDISTESHVANNPTCDDRAASTHGSNQVSMSSKNKVCDPRPVTNRDIRLDQNVKNVTDLAQKNPFHPYKLLGHVKTKEASECGSSTGPLEENESFRKWNEMKRNGFLSSSHGGIPMPMPKPKPKPKQCEKKKKTTAHSRKKKRNDVPKKKMEIAKREQVNRFTKIAAPSGLLNGLNPGIINHVRNSKQVRSIIEALVKSKKREESVQESSAEHHKKGINEDKCLPRMHESETCRSSSPLGNQQEDTLLGSVQTRDLYTSSSLHAKPFCSESSSAYGGCDIAEEKYRDEISSASHPTSDHEDEKLKLDLSSHITIGSENLSVIKEAVIKEESANNASVSSLSVKASTVASQWLELIYQDIRGRLAALRRSKKRVQAVIQTELPFLLSKEFSSTKENDIHSSQSSTDRCPNNATLDMHRARWTALFVEMEKALSEEGKNLENWLNQVKEMQLHCEQGLQCVSWHGVQLLGRPDIGARLKKDTMEKELAVRAAAASIYSTCNLITAKENVSCF